MIHLLEYLESFEYDDSEDYIGKIIKRVKTTNDQFFEWSFRKWFVAMIASLIDPSFVNHATLVIVGKQSAGKSRFIKSLVPKQLDNYFHSGKLNLKNKETQLFLSQMFLICMDEFKNRQASQVDDLKEIITKGDIVIRNLRKHSSRKYIRRASFAATCNDFDILVDPTGSRRFLCNEILEVDNESPIELDKAYAQAFHLISTGFDFIFGHEDVKRIEAKNQDYYHVDVLEDQLFSYFSKPEKGDEEVYMSNMKILDYLYLHFKTPITDSNSKKLGRILKKHGFKKLSRKGRRVYALKKLTENEQTLPDEKQAELDTFIQNLNLKKVS